MIFEGHYPSCCVIVYHYQPFQASNMEGLYFAALVQPKSCFLPAISLHFSAYFFGKVGSRVFPILKWVKWSNRDNFHRKWLLQNTPFGYTPQSWTWPLKNIEKWFLEDCFPFWGWVMLNVQGVTNQSTSGLAEPCRGNWDPRQLFVPAMDAVDVGPWARLKLWRWQDTVSPQKMEHIWRNECSEPKKLNVSRANNFCTTLKAEILGIQRWGLQVVCQPLEALLTWRRVQVLRSREDVLR